MKRPLCFLCLLLTVSVCHAKPLDGLLLESAAPLRRGVWDMKFGLDFGSGAEPIDLASVLSTKSVEVDVIQVPLEIRYGLSDRAEIGWSIGFEADNGPGITVGGPLFDASGLQRVRMFGKWKIRPRISWMVDAALGGKNSLYDGNDGLDFGVKFMASPRIGNGYMLMNAGVVIKAGNSDVNDNGIPEEFDNPIVVGIGYIYPFTTRFTGIFELAGSSSPLKGVAGGYTTNDLLTVGIGGRYGWSDHFYLNTGAGFGVAAGSPTVSFKLGLEWLLGDVREFAQSPESSDFWAPSAQLQEEVKKQQERRQAAKTWTPQEESEDQIARAAESFQRGDYIAAVALYESAARMKATDPVLFYNLATIYFLMRRYASAKPNYERAVRLNPNDIDSHLYLGYTYFYLNNSAAAAVEWQSVLNLDPDNATARDNLRSMGVE